MTDQNQGVQSKNADRPYAETNGQDLAAMITDMTNVIAGMAKMDMGTAHESRMLHAMKQEQECRAA